MYCNLIESTGDEIVELDNEVNKRNNKAKLLRNTFDVVGRYEMPLVKK